MTKNTKIEWAHHTFNPWIGCTKVGPGCDNCYAEADFSTRRKVVQWGAGQPRKHTAPSTWAQPLRWNAEAQRLGVRYRVFCASLADVFDNEVPEPWRWDLFRLIAATPHLDWLLLTKRVGNARAMLNSAAATVAGEFVEANEWDRSPWPNVWIGATICNQDEADRDIPKLLAVPAAKRFLSMEPLLGPVDLTRHFLRCCGCFVPGHPGDGWMQPPDPPACCGDLEPTELHWVIVGGESGPNARPMHPDWARSLRDQCAAAGVPFMFKQWGEFDLSYDRDRDDPDRRKCNLVDKQPGRWVNLVGGHGFNGERVHYAHKVGKKAAGRLLDEREWNEVPA